MCTYLIIPKNVKLMFYLKVKLKDLRPFTAVNNRECATGCHLPEGP